MTARTVTVAPAWGVGCVASRPWPVSAADIADETEVAVDHLERLGVPAGGLVLIVSRLADTVHVAPLEHAAGRLSARWSSADATGSDAFRTASLIRQLTPDAVVGVNATVAGAVPEGTFDDVPAVAVVDDAAHDVIPNARWWLRIGPTSAFECAARVGAHFDESRWHVESIDGELVISNRTPRLTPATRLPTGLHGRVRGDECPCGSRQPRIQVERR